MKPIINPQKQSKFEQCYLKLPWGKMGSYGWWRKMEDPSQNLNKLFKSDHKVCCQCSRSAQIHMLECQNKSARNGK